MESTREESNEKKLSKYVTLISSDNYKFVIKREAAYRSSALREMFHSDHFIEAQRGEVVLQEIAGAVLEKVCEYLCYNLKYKDEPEPAEFDVPPEMSLELLMAADFLDGE